MIEVETDPSMMLGYPKTKSYERKATLVRKTCGTPVQPKQIHPVKMSSTGQMHFSDDRVLHSIADSCLSNGTQYGGNSARNLTNVFPERTRRSPVKPNGSHHLFPQNPKWTSEGGKPVHRPHGFENRKPRKFRKLLPVQPNSPQMLYRARKKIRVANSQKTPRQMMSRIFQAGYDQMNSSGGNTTPRSSPQKTTTYSPNCSLFSSPGMSKMSLLDEGDPFKSPLPVKKCFKRRYSAIGTPTQASPFNASFISSSGGSSSWLQTPSSIKVYKSKRKLPIQTDRERMPKPPRASNSERPRKQLYEKREKAELDFTACSPVNDESDVWARNTDTDLSPEIPLLNTPQQRKIALNVRSGGTLSSTDNYYAGKEFSGGRTSSEETILKYNKAENSYLDCDDDESVIEDCSSPESEPRYEEAGWKIQLKTKSEISPGQNKTSVNLVEEALANLSNSQQKSQRKAFSRMSTHTLLSKKEYKSHLHKQSSARSNAASMHSKHRVISKGYSPIVGDPPPDHLSKYSLPPDSSFTSSNQKSDFQPSCYRKDNFSGTKFKKPNIRVAQTLNMSPEPVEPDVNEEEEPIFPPLDMGSLRVKRSSKSKCFYKKKVLNTIHVTSHAMASIRDDFEDFEESAADKKWKKLLSDSAHIVDGVSSKLKVTASSASDIQLQSEYEIDIGGSIMDESVGFYESYRK